MVLGFNAEKKIKKRQECSSGRDMMGENNSF
jgi:hypothetical protein